MQALNNSSTAVNPLKTVAVSGSEKPSSFTRQYLLPDSPNRPLLENAHAAVFLNITPARNGYALVVPKRQVTLMKDLTPKERHDLIDMVTGYQQLWQQLPENQGRNFQYSVFINDGKHAGQFIPHVHIHVVPIAEDEPLPKGGLRAFFRDSDTYGLPGDKQKKRNYPAFEQLYRLFNDNPDVIQQVAQQQDVDTRFQAVA